MGSASLPNPEQWGTWLVQFKGNHHVIGHKAPVVVVRFNQFLYSKKDDQGVVRRNQVGSPPFNPCPCRRGQPIGCLLPIEPQVESPDGALVARCGARCVSTWEDSSHCNTTSPCRCIYTSASLDVCRGDVACTWVSQSGVRGTIGVCVCVCVCLCVCMCAFSELC